MEQAVSAHWILSPPQPPRRMGSIVVDKTTGQIAELTAAEADDLASPGEGTLFLTPGLINAHTHLSLTAPEPIPLDPDTETMADWILKVVAWARSRDEAQRRQACMQGILEMIRTGTTCVNDITDDGLSLEALSQVGMRGIVSLEFFHPAHDKDPDLTQLTETWQALRSRFGRHPLLTLGLSPHSPYNVTPEAWQKAVKLLAPAVVHTHLAETEEELAWFQAGHSALDRVHETLLGQRFGPAAKAQSPLDSIAPQLASNWIVAHGTFLTPEDWAQLPDAGASLAHCPRSNRWIAGETLTNLSQIQAQGMAVGLGTDSRLSSPDLDLRAEARTARLLHHLSAEATLALITEGSARAIKQGHCLGQLKPGYAADMVLWWHPASHVADPYEAWLAPETEPVLVMINGRVVLERRPEAAAAWAD